MDFVILDTEGKPNLTELAIVDSQGVVIYEGFCDEYLNIRFLYVNRQKRKLNLFSK
jgi:hypothetical protein